MGILLADMPLFNALDSPLYKALAQDDSGWVHQVNKGRMTHSEAKV